MTVSEVKQTITCEDGRALAATLYVPTKKIDAAVMIAGATGIKKEFYSKFSTYLARHNVAVLSFDYRGIGESRLGPISKEKANLIDWGQLDMAAAFDTLRKTFPDVSHHIMGHSAGGQLVGLMHNYQDIHSHLCFAASSGCLKNMRPIFRIKATFFLWVFIPLCNLFFHHTKAQWVNMGEPLPKGVARQWRQWCSDYGYVKNAFGKEITSHHFNDIDIPSLWINATDDAIANHANVSDMLSVFPKLRAKRVTLDAHYEGLSSIGHMRFFSQSSKHLWWMVIEWLREHQPD